MILYDIENFCKTECGYAQLNPLTSLKKEDRMESFFISESLKYLYLLFDEGINIYIYIYKYISIYFKI